MKPIKEGKVREIYDNGDSLIMVATDRISCFDVILNNQVTKKGTVLTQMSKFWFDMTEDILPNHMISVDVKDMPEFFQQPQFDGNSMLCRKLNMLPIECIVRGYITGSGWASYKENGTVCGASSVSCNRYSCPRFRSRSIAIFLAIRINHARCDVFF
jgi:phosphoribosylaminoimidazole-succinocarboxamide synthase